MNNFIKFENGDIPVHKIVQGTPVEWDGDIYFISGIEKDRGTHGHRLTLVKPYEEQDVLSKFVLWLNNNDL